LKAIEKGGDNNAQDTMNRNSISYNSGAAINWSTKLRNRRVDYLKDNLKNTSSLIIKFI